MARALRRRRTPRSRRCARRASARAARRVYVTLEPCNHLGKTPPCTDALIAAGVARVVVAAARSAARSRGGGAERLRAAGIEVDGRRRGGGRARAQRAVLPRARRAIGRGCTLKLALSLDGAIADHTRRAGLAHRRESRGARCTGCARAPTRSPSASARCSPTTRSSPCATCAAAACRADARRVRHARRGCRATSQLARTAARVAGDRGLLGARPAHARARWSTPASTLAARRHARATRCARCAQRGIRSLLVEGGAALARRFVQRGARRPPDYLSGTRRARRRRAATRSVRCRPSRAGDARRWRARARAALRATTR